MKTPTVLLLCMAYFTAGCDTINDIRCFNDKDDGYFVLRSIPAFNASVGDTLWVDHRSYWTGSARCMDGYGQFTIRGITVDPLLAQVEIRGPYIGIIPQKSISGLEVDILGRVSLFRHGLTEVLDQTLRFRIVVLEQGGSDLPEPDDLPPAFIRLERLTFESVQNVLPDSTRYVAYHLASVPELASLRPVSVIGFARVADQYRELRQLGNRIDFRWHASDTLLQASIGVYPPETLPASARVMYFRSFGIRGLPATSPFNQRTYTVIGLP